MNLLTLAFDFSNPLDYLSKWILNAAVSAWKIACGMALNAGTLSETQWATTFIVVNKVAGIMGFVAVAVGAVGIVQAAFKGSLGDVVSTVFRTILAWPMTVIIITITWHALAVEGSVTSTILTFAFGDKKIPNIELDPNVPINADLNIGVVAVIAVLLLVGSLVMLLVMIARSFLIMLAIAFAPVVIMTNSWSSLRPALTKWGSFMTGLVLFKPVVAIIIYMTGTMIQAAPSGDMMSYYVGIVGMVLASVLPWKLVSVVSTFLPGAMGLNQAAASGHATVSGVVDTAKTAAAIGVGVATGGASMASGFGGLTGSLADDFAPGMINTGASTDADTSDSDSKNTGDMADTSSESSSGPSTDNTATDSSSSSSAASSASGLVAGVGSFMGSASGVLAAAASSGMAPSGAAQAMQAGSRVADVISQVSAAHTTSGYTNDYTSGSAEVPTAAAAATPVTTPVGDQTSSLVTTDTQHVDVNVHVDSSGDASASVSQ
ncbi:hypothetical protein QP096_07215 [Alloscardovia omnicolens]|uniref:hypothetical protein n=1 Tax=Alloscardovia omnicolens TaxID=419015 RepID=UPI0025509ADF|nr:hypothetical protein [Alloscardovia omnicolens]MDK6251778.1 hypothetical protein [Alloscardovia omnicolens]MDK6663292.1 hypothetical protein [Alloscardovia omnicolens]MDK7747216.1 hypothetical protein [Alloscardovia omnicolens]MDU3532771.1 hypothetical protein [Alloscardovia omnicolens]